MPCQYDYDIVYVRGIRHGDDKLVIWPEVFGPLHMETGADLMLLHPDGREDVLVIVADRARARHCSLTAGRRPRHRR